jgi:hypothetical protein
MHASETEVPDVNERRLNPEDQAKVDAFLQSGVNSVERKPFRPIIMILLLIAVVTGFSLLSQGIALWAGIYWFFRVDFMMPPLKPFLCDVVRGLTAHFPQGDVIQVV